MTHNPVKPSGYYLNYPSLDLFLYHLKEGLGESEIKIQANHQQFWSNLPLDVHVPWEKESQVKDTEFLRLLTLISGNKTHRIATELLDKRYPIGGYYYPVLMNDTYGLLLDVEVEDKDTYDASYFAYLKTIGDEKQGDLGKIWMISGYRDLHSNQKTIDIAKAAYTALMGEEWKAVKNGKFLGGDIFEAWANSQYWRSVVDTEKTPVLIIIYPNSNIMNKARKFYDYWLRLLCYRNKILWAYSQSRQHARTLQKQLSMVNDTILLVKESQLNLSELKEKLKLCTDYAIQLEQLEILKQSIEINLQNYQECLKTIADSSSNIGDTQLDFFSDFTPIFKDKYLQQISKDQTNFKSGLSILENLINVIRSVVEIEQSERDRNIENLISAAGIGVGTASAAAGAGSALVKDFTQFYWIKVDKNDYPFAEPLSNLLIVLLFSLGSGWVIGWRSLKLLQSPHKLSWWRSLIKFFWG